MSYNTVFIVEPVIRTGVISSLQEAVHFVLIEIDHAHVAVVVIIVDKIGAGLAVSYFFLFHKCSLSDVFHGECGDSVKTFIGSYACEEIIASLTGYHSTVIAAELFLRHIEIEPTLLASGRECGTNSGVS